MRIPQTKPKHATAASSAKRQSALNTNALDSQLKYKNGVVVATELIALILFPGCPSMTMLLLDRDNYIKELHVKLKKGMSDEEYHRLCFYASGKCHTRNVTTLENLHVLLPDQMRDISSSENLLVTKSGHESTQHWTV